jgi:hypothetical protein
MMDEPASSPAKPPKTQRAQQRQERLKSALKANMAKRKVQVRARSDGTAPQDGDEKQEQG